MTIFINSKRTPPPPVRERLIADQNSPRCSQPYSPHPCCSSPAPLPEEAARVQPAAEKAPPTPVEAGARAPLPLRASPPG